MIRCALLQNWCYGSFAWFRELRARAATPLGISALRIGYARHELRDALD